MKYLILAVIYLSAAASSALATPTAHHSTPQQGIGTTKLTVALGSDP